MNQRDEIIRNIRSAPSLRAQASHVMALEAFDRGVGAQAAQDGAWDAASAIVNDTLRPRVAMGHVSSAQSDWLGEFEAASDYAQRISAEAASWFSRTSAAVRQDPEEFREQATGYMRRQASQFGENAQAAYDHGLQYLTFLRTQAASGLPQVQQLVDSQENPAQTPQPDDVFDNFAGPLHPINEPVFGTETSERAPLLQQIEQEGGGQAGAPSHHDETQQFAGPPPQEAVAGGANQATGDNFPRTASYDGPSVAINHAMTLDDFIRAEAASNGLKYHVYRQDINGRGVQHSQEPFDSKSEAEEWMKDSRAAEGRNGRVHYLVSEDAKGQRLPYPEASLNTEAASSLDQIEQTVDAHENPRPTALPEDYAFPWEIDTHDEGLDERSDKKASFDPEAYQRRAAYVAGLAARDPQTLTSTERNEVIAFTATLQKRADQWSQGGDQSHGPSPANNPGTTPQPGVGFEDGKHDREIGDAPTYGDASSSVPENVQQYSKGYSSTEAQTGAQPGQMPPGAGGMQQGYETHAASRKTAGLRQISASFTTDVERADPDFAKGHKYASKWREGKRLVTTGSASFEAGLYAGISDNPSAQEAWVRVHREASAKYKNRAFLSRIALHRSFSKQAAAALGMQVVGGYLKQAATTTDLDSMDSSSSPDATGQTPISGPGTPPPLQGGSNPARPGGIPPYQEGGSPVAPHTPAGMGGGHGQPTAINTQVGGPVDQAAAQRLSPQTQAFRRRVQAGLVKNQER